MITRAAEKILNISPHELPRTSYAWLIRLIFKIGLVVGWTMVISVFVSRFSISALPVLFLVQAAFTIAGMLLFSFLLERIEARWMMVASGFTAGLLLFASTFFYTSDAVFFPLVLLASGVFLPQITIFLSNYIEDFFTPRECERTFPVIESAETIGGIVGGLILSAPFFGVAGYKALYLWVFLLYVFLAVLFLFQPKSPQFYSSLYEMKVLPRAKRLRWHGLMKGLEEIKRIPFLQILIVVFFLQWLLTHFLEFQYTKVVDEAVGAHGSEMSHEESLAHGLGSLHMIFYGSALLVQLLLASRLLRFLGTFGGFLFHALVSFMSAVSMMFGFGYFTVVLAKNNFEVSGIISKNAYEASYYAFRHGTQKALREFFEGLVAPAATIAATLSLLAVQNFFVEEHSLLVMNLFLVFFTGFMLFLSFHLQKGYTSMVRQNLFLSDKKMARLHAIEILAQKGHVHALEILVEALNKTADRDVIIKILNALARIGDVKVLPDILKYLKSDEDEVVAAAIASLLLFPVIGRRHFHHIFSRQQVIEDLKHVFHRNPDLLIKKDALKALVLLDPNVAPFLLETLRDSGPGMQEVCIRVMRSFRDPAVADVLRPYMHSPDAFVRANALAILCRFGRFKKEARVLMEAMMRSSGRRDILAACGILSDIPSPKIFHHLQRHLKNTDDEIRLAAAFGLLKLGCYRAAQPLADLLFQGNPIILRTAKLMANELDGKVKRVLNDALQQEATRRGRPYGAEECRDPGLMEEMAEPALQSLKKAYECLGSHEEAGLVEAILEFRSQQPAFATQTVS